MKILAVSDEECAALWDYYTPGKLDDIDLIIRQIKQIMSFNDLKALIHHGSRIDRYFRAHTPDRMIQSLLQSDIKQIIAVKITESSA